MARDPSVDRPDVIAYLYYEDPGAAILFMETAFGFEIETVLRAPDDRRVLHATVRAGQGLVFVGPGMALFGTSGVGDAERVSSMMYVYVADVGKHYARAKEAGATIREELHVHGAGNRQYTASDPGGQRWTFAEPVEREP